MDNIAVLRRVVAFLCVRVCMVEATASSSPLKILALHGGGGSANSFRNSQGMRDLALALPNVEFVFAQAPYGSTNTAVWMRDPTGGKGQPTTSVNWARDSVAALDNIVATQGPFFGILGYSQGSAFIPVYLAQGSAQFDVALMFCGYLPGTHQGLLGSINAASPFNSISSLVWMGEQDFLISNAMTNQQASKFTSPSVIRSVNGDHAVPGTSDSTFNQVVAFIEQQANDRGPTPTSPPSAMRACRTFRNSRGCNRAPAGCRWARVRGRKRCVSSTTSPPSVSAPTASPIVRCRSLRRAQQCNRASACRWKARTRRCVVDTRVITAVPTPEATQTPTSSSPPTSTNCLNIRNRNRCRNKSDCKWSRGNCLRT